MAIQINNGFSTFDTFVQFAKSRSAAGLKGDVANATMGLDDRRISVVTVGSARSTNAAWLSRTGDDKTDNDRTREIFKTAIAKMFGGEKKIPEDVVKAMEMENYGQGKPLTARRILLVKAAIDKTDASIREAAVKLQISGQRVFEQKLQPETQAALAAKGYTKTELPLIARAVRGYVMSQNVSEAEAVREVTTPGTKANRLASYGGRFLLSSKNFAHGLRLLDSFDAWYTDLRDFQKAHADNRGGDTPTKLNVDDYVTANDQRRGLEAMIFQHIAADPSIDLKKSGEEVFGMKNNAAMRFFGRGLHKSVLGTVLNVPPAKRGAVFAAVDLFQPLFKNEAEAVAKRRLRPAERKITEPELFVSRCAAHADELYSLMAKGQLTAKNIVKICFPDIRKPGKCDLKALNAGLDDLLNRVTAGVGDDNDMGAKLKMLGTGCTADEVVKFYQDGTPPPKRPYVTDWAMPLNHYEGGGFKQMSADLVRSFNYSPIVNGVPDEDAKIVPENQVQNNIAFPDGTRLACSGRAEHRDNLAQAEAKIKALCGEVHGFQAEVVAFCLSQSGKSPIRHALLAHGIFNAEHAVLDMSLSRDAATGDVTIHYRSPESLPVRFGWSTTVHVDGTTFTTPLRVETPIRQMSAEEASKMVDEAADQLDYEVPRENLAICAELLAQNATGLLPRYAKILAQFLVRLPFDDENADISRQKAVETANSLRTTRSFGFGDPRLKELENAIKDGHNAYIATQLAKNPFPVATKDGSPNVFDAMTSDIARSHVVINGQTFAKDADTDFQAVYAAFKKALPAEKAQKAVSSLMHQGGLGDLTLTLMKHPILPDDGGDPRVLFNLPGADLLFQRDMTAENAIFEKPQFDGNQALDYDLEVTPDGNTAVLTMRMQSPIMMGNAENVDEGFGQIRIAQKLTIDLTPEVPVVTDVKLSQILDS